MIMEPFIAGRVAMETWITAIKSGLIKAAKSLGLLNAAQEVR